MLNANLYSVSINYCSYKSWPQFLSIVREHISFLCVQFICQFIWHVRAIISKNIVQQFGIKYYKCNIVTKIMYGIKPFLFKMSVLIGDVTLHIAEHAKHVLEFIYSVCLCVSWIQLLLVLWAREFTVLSCIFSLMHFANNSLF